MKTKNLWMVSVDYAKRSSLATLNESNASDEKIQKPRKFFFDCLICLFVNNYNNLKKNRGCIYIVLSSLKLTLVSNQTKLISFSG